MIAVYHRQKQHINSSADEAESFHRVCIIGSAEALPILCVSDFCERERDRERERDACDVIRYHAEIASDHAYDYLDGASTQRVDAF